MGNRCTVEEWMSMSSIMYTSIIHQTHIDSISDGHSITSSFQTSSILRIQRIFCDVLVLSFNAPSSTLERAVLSSSRLLSGSSHIYECEQVRRARLAGSLLRFSFPIWSPSSLAMGLGCSCFTALTSGTSRQWSEYYDTHIPISVDIDEQKDVIGSRLIRSYVCLWQICVSLLSP